MSDFEQVDVRLCRKGESMSLSTEALARSSGRRPWRTVIIWVVALVAAGVLSSQLLGDTLTTESSRN